MLTEEELIRLIDSTESQYMRCWSVLCALKQGVPPSESWIPEFLEFQPTLAGSLLKQERFRREVHSERRDLIARKKVTEIQHFRSRMKLLDEYLRVIDVSISIGKCLGDSFAWLFYQKETGLLREHQKHQEVFHIHPGIGGIGEIEVIKKLRIVDSQLVIYHGTTTFLRVGDVSLIDLPSLTVTGIGEIKTKRVGAQELSMTTIMIGPRSRANVPSFGPDSGKRQVHDAGLPHDMKQKLATQLNAICGSFNALCQKDAVKLSSNMYVRELAEVGEELLSNNFALRRAGDGLLISGVKSDKKPLSARLLDDSKDDLDAELNRVALAAREIVDWSFSENSIVINSLHYPASSRYALIHGMTPIFWWPLSLDFLRGIIFYEIGITTLYNPVHLVKRLRKSGWTVSYEKRTNTYTVTKEKDGQVRAIIADFPNYVMLVQRGLLNEDVIVQGLEACSSRIEGCDLQGNVLVEVDLSQRFA